MDVFVQNDLELGVPVYQFSTLWDDDREAR